MPREVGRLREPRSAPSDQRQKTKREPETGPGVGNTPHADRQDHLRPASLSGVLQSGYGGPEGVPTCVPRRARRLEVLRVTPFRDRLSARSKGLSTPGADKRRGRH